MNKIFNYIKQNKDTKLLIVADEKQAMIARDCASYLGLSPFVLSDLRANFGDDLLSFSDEIKEMTSTLETFHQYKKQKFLYNLISCLFTCLLRPQRYL